MRTRYLYSELASTVDAYKRCANNLPQKEEWCERHEERIIALVKRYMPSGSGFDCGTELQFDESNANKLVFTTSFHHMDDNGYYCGWSEHTVTVTPSFIGDFSIRISGRNRNDIKEYIYQAFEIALHSELKEGK